MTTYIPTIGTASIHSLPEVTQEMAERREEIHVGFPGLYTAYRATWREDKKAGTAEGSWSYYGDGPIQDWYRDGVTYPSQR